ncbi:MAG: hypothetical protein IPL79_12730 [Myxococcales bacterium]|nr:hypothetical protein [Myxococcales bacterium]
MKTTVNRFACVGALSALLASACGNDAATLERPCAATFYDNDVLADTATYTWDGSKLLSVDYITVGGVASSEQFDYEGNKLTKRIYTEGSTVSTSLRAYDVRGRLISDAFSSSDDPSGASTSTYTYDDQPIPAVELVENATGDTDVFTRTFVSKDGGLEATVDRCQDRSGGGEYCDDYQETWGLGLAEEFMPSLESDYATRFGVQRIAFFAPTFQSIYTWHDRLMVSQTTTSYPGGGTSNVVYAHSKTLEGARVVAEERDVGDMNYKVNYSYDCP